MFRVRSVVPDSSRLFGSGMTEAVGSKRAVMTPVTGVPLPLFAGGVATARGLLLPPPHAASSADDNASAKLFRACIGSFLGKSVDTRRPRILGSSNARWQRGFNELAGTVFAVATQQKSAGSSLIPQYYFVSFSAVLRPVRTPASACQHSLPG